MNDWAEFRGLTEFGDGAFPVLILDGSSPQLESGTALEGVNDLDWAVTVSYRDAGRLVAALRTVLVCPDFHGKPLESLSQALVVFRLGELAEEDHLRLERGGRPAREAVSALPAGSVVVSLNGVGVESPAAVTTSDESVIAFEVPVDEGHHGYVVGVRTALEGVRLRTQVTGGLDAALHPPT